MTIDLYRVVPAAVRISLKLYNAYNNLNFLTNIFLLYKIRKNNSIHYSLHDELRFFCHAIYEIALVSVLTV